MSWCHGWQVATNVQDERYVVVPWMAKNAYVQDVTLIQKQVQHDEVFRINNRHPEFISGSSLCI
ncbi:MAG: hypothetical protein V7780_11965 [Colwellia sp.]